MARTKFPSAKSAVIEIGATGLNYYDGRISEETMRKLKGQQGIKTYKEMADNDPTIGAVLFAIDKLLRNVPWKVTPVDDSPEAVEVADFYTSCMDDMEHSWGEFIQEALSMLPFGFAPHEMVFKVRDDGKIGWKKLPIRSQDTLEKWEIDDNGNVTGMVQTLPNGIFSNKTIPIEKLLLFRTESRKNNPQGKSILRNCFRPWYFKKRIEEIEGIGIERDLAGLPVAQVPPSLLSADASPEEKAVLNAVKKMITSIRRDEQEGVVFPLAYDENGKEIYKLSLLSTGGTRQFDTSKIIDRYDKRIAMTVLADFIFLGQSRVGSFALSSDKTDMFALAIGAWLGSIADTINRHGVPVLGQLNGIPKNLWPKFTPGDIEKEDVSKFCDNIYKLVGVGALIPDQDVQEKIRELLGLPVKVSDGKEFELPEPKPFTTQMKDEE